jgi:hypothetical protein
MWGCCQFHRRTKRLCSRQRYIPRGRARCGGGGDVHAKQPYFVNALHEKKRCICQGAERTAFEAEEEEEGVGGGEGGVRVRWLQRVCTTQQFGCVHHLDNFSREV